MPPVHLDLMGIEEQDMMTMLAPIQEEYTQLEALSSHSLFPLCFFSHYFSISINPPTPLPCDDNNSVLKVLALDIAKFVTPFC